MKFKAQFCLLGAEFLLFLMHFKVLRLAKVRFKTLMHTKMVVIFLNTFANKLMFTLKIPKFCR